MTKLGTALSWPQAVPKTGFKEVAALFDQILVPRDLTAHIVVAPTVAFKTMKLTNGIL